MKGALRTVLGLTTVLLLSACNLAADISETTNQAEAAAVLLERDLGVKPYMGWNINNGVLTNVSVTFEGRRLSTVPLGELQAKTRTAVLTAFKQSPKQITLSVAFVP